MKKAALTIGLFSLVLVATSFTTIENVNTISNQELSINPPVLGGGMTGSGRKLDNHVVNEESIMNNNQSGFADTNQSLGANKKID